MDSKYTPGTRVRVKRTSGAVEDNWIVIWGFGETVMIQRLDDAYKTVTTKDLESWKDLELDEV